MTVIILNWNGRSCLPACLDSVRAQTCPDLQVVVVDNASTDGSESCVREILPGAALIRNAANLGYGAGNNVGIAASRTEYVAVLNNDAVLDPGCLAELRRALSSDSRVGACAPKILLSGDGLLDAAGIAPCADGLALGRGRMEPARRYDRQEEVFFASGCCALFRKAMLDDIGGYDEDFFAYGEDTDLGWRARARGWKCLYVPSAVVVHRHSASTGSHSPAKAYWVERNRLCVAVKNFPLALLLAGLPYTLCRYAWQAFGALRGRGRAGKFTRDHSAWRLAGVLLRAYGGALRLLPRMLSKRKAIRASCRIPDGEYFRLLGKHGLRAKAVALKD